MFDFNFFRKDSSEKIYWENPDNIISDISNIFLISNEDNSLRVKSDYVNYLFTSISEAEFISSYKEYYHRLNLNLTTFTHEGKSYSLSDIEVESLKQKMILKLIRYYDINGGVVKIRPRDFHWVQVVNELRWLLDKKIGDDEKLKYSFGAHIIRMKGRNYVRMIQGQINFENNMD